MSFVFTQLFSSSYFCFSCFGSCYFTVYYICLIKSKVKWCIYIAPFPCNMLKGALQWSVYPQRTESIYRCLWQPLQIGPYMLVLILPTLGGWKAEWTLAGKKVTQIFNPRPGRESNRGPQDWEAEILTTAPTPPLCFLDWLLTFFEAW